MLRLKRKLTRPVAQPTVQQSPPPIQVVDTNPVSDDSLMRTGKIDLGYIIKRGDEIQTLCHDHTVYEPNKVMTAFVNDEDSISVRFEGMSQGNLGHETDFSRFALGQFCSKIGVPTQYIQKCLKAEKTDLAVENINAWLKDYDKPLFLRGYDKCHVRGVLSNKYSVCDTPDILSGISDVLPVNDYNIKGWFLNEEFLHLRLVSRERIDIDGEDLYPGISIESSDVGKSNLNVSFFIWKKVCTNGLIVPKKFGVLFHQKHIGVTSQQFSHDLRESFDLIEPVTAKVRESIEKTADRRLETAFSDEDSLATLISRVKDLCNFGEEHSKKVISLMELGVYEKSQWGLANSITQIAQEFPMERRLELERAAGQLLVA